MLTETAYAVPLSSGITVFVQPLTIYEIRLMQAQVKTVYPDPLPKDFKSLVAGTTTFTTGTQSSKRSLRKRS
jgi:hypothetical protein